MCVSFLKLCLVGEKIHFSNTQVFFKIMPAVSQQSALRWNKYYTLPNHIPLITTNLLGCFNCSFFKAKKLPEWLHLSTVHITQCSALSVPLTLDSPPVMPVKPLRLSRRSKLNHTTEVKSHPITNIAVAEFPKSQCSRLTCSSSYASTPLQPGKWQSWSNEEMPRYILISWSYSCPSFGWLGKKSSTWHDLMQILSALRDFWKKFSLHR